MRRELSMGLVLAVLTLGVYWPVRTHDFIYYDDPEFILENQQIQSGLNAKTIVYAFSQPVVGNWHPITTLSHALDCELFGLNAGAHHLVNVLFHAANAFLVFLLLQRWRQQLAAGGQAEGHTSATAVMRDNSFGAWVRFSWPSILAALLFALHPLRVESVAWVAERKDMLSGFFFLLTLWMYTWYVQETRLKKYSRETGRATPMSHKAWKLYLMSLATFALGLMSKPMLVTVPFVLFLIDYWPLRRFEISTFRSDSKVRPLVLEKMPFLFLSIIDCWITLLVQKSTGAMLVIQNVTWLERFSNAVTSYARYLGKSFWPARLAIVYPHPAKHYYLSDQWPSWEILLATLLLLLISIFCLLQLRPRPYLAVGWFWFLGMLVPVIGLVQVGEQAMADRYSYLPLIGPVISIVWWLSEKFQSASPSSRSNAFGSFNAFSGTALSMLVTITLIFLTRNQLGWWQDTISLFQHAVAVTADNPSAQFALGVGLEKESEPAKAMVRYRVATAIDPQYAKAHYNLGQLLRKSGHWQAAADAYLAAERVNPRDLATELNLASVLPPLGRYREAVDHFDQALMMDSNSIEGLNNLAWLLSTSPDSSIRDGPRAVALAERGCSLTDSKMPVLLGTLAAAYAEAGRFAEAIVAAERASATAMQSGDTATASKNQQLLALYRENRPYREAINNQ